MVNNRTSVLRDVGVNQVIFGDSLELAKQLLSESVNCIITSPPYFGLRDYGVRGQLGLEKTLGEYIIKLVVLFRELHRVLREDGTVWLNLGDSYANGDKWGGKHARALHGQRGLGREKVKTGFRPKNLMGVPWRVALALQLDGWNLRQDIIWHKPNAMPESVRDRCTKSHEYIFLLSKSAKYFYDYAAIKEQLKSDPKSWGRHTRKDPGKHAVRSRPMFGAERNGRDGSDWGDGKSRNKRSVWSVSTSPFKGAHFATFPPNLVKPCILAGCPKEGLVLDPFIGSGTTGVVCRELGRNWLGFELDTENASLIAERMSNSHGK